MNVQDLVECAPFCDTVEIIVRENGQGQWIQGYLIGKNIDVYPAFQRMDYLEMKALERFPTPKQHLKPKEEAEGMHGGRLKMKLIRKDVSKIPDNLKSLRVCDYQPRHIPCYHREQMTHNEFQLDINCYPEGWEDVKAETKTETKDIQLPGQMSIFDLED